MNSRDAKAHMKRCNEFCQESGDNTARMLKWVLSTIQQQLETTPDIVDSFESLGVTSPFAFGSKADGLQYIQEHRGTLYYDALNHKNDAFELMKVFLRVPGLGLVKAGFACQLFNSLVGCLDVHNLKMYDIPISAVQMRKTSKPKTQDKKILHYIELCGKLGGSVKLWQKWCDYKASIALDNWTYAGYSVSMFHVEVLNNNVSSLTLKHLNDKVIT